MMKLFQFILVALLVFPMESTGQKVFKVRYESQADIKVFVVEYESQAEPIRHLQRIGYLLEVMNNWFAFR